MGVDLTILRLVFMRAKPGNGGKRTMNEVVEKILLVALGAIGGALIGYQFRLSLAKRKEYNELADKLFLIVDQELDEAAAHWFSISGKDAKLIARQMNLIQRRKFERAIKDYKLAASKTKQDGSGQMFFCDPGKVNEALKSIAKLLKRR